MIKLEISNDNMIIILNASYLSDDNKRNLDLFLGSSSRIAQNFLTIKNDTQVNTQNLSYSLIQIKKYLDKSRIKYILGETIKKFESKQTLVKDNFFKLKKIGENLKLNIEIIPEEFIWEYKDFEKFTKKSFQKEHIPYPNQLRSAFFHLKMKKSCNFSDPGTGKTTIVYSLFNWLKNKEEDEIDAIFIIGPLSSFHSWEKEYEECFWRVPNCIDFKAKSFASRLKISNIEDLDRVYFLNYDRVDSYKEELIEFFQKYRILLVLDEAHRLKNPVSRRFKALNCILNASGIKIPYQIILTGTPIPNGYENFHSYFDLIRKEEPKILSKQFHELRKIENTDLLKIAELTKEIFPFFYKLKKEKMKNFKIPIEKLQDCSMDEFQNELFDRLRKNLIDSWDKENDIQIHLNFYRSKLIRLMQIQTDLRMISQPVDNIIYSNTNLNDNDEDLDDNDFEEIKNLLKNKSFEKEIEELALNSSDIKVKLNTYVNQKKIPEKYIQLIEIVKKLLNNNQKIIIWTNWIFTINEIHRLLKNEGINSGLLYGKIKYEEKLKTIDKFNNLESNELMVLIANPASVAESISLHKACQNAIYFDINYNVTNYFQSKDRIHRYGMLPDKEQVTYYYFLSGNGLEKYIFNSNKSKEQQMKEFFISNDKTYNSFIPESTDVEGMKKVINILRKTNID
ncbi:SNF2-related protein [Spiroplasma platyhelix]|uniref:DEAD/DEAH box helicase n=1 Tax=Spiroplasma platyhelix PALS-1 TaxID=1276218 RepID=A0A846TWQ9_9MOLU|nr:DEAD/DEAH box helicase [Spiroplasma platyhelix]MBE4704249.1 hypothetical protein [Spiroplasma platyhelix PALS-1]NKE38622.1 DEAD/DEAH box helicase [Spiroplasma platyhelix PALS-1]UJB28833.1 hypothetical protein SPLAT_v1c00660 [Spiroplasma platyhelix PALS-1]